MKDSMLRTDIRIKPTQWTARMLFTTGTTTRTKDAERLVDFDTIAGRENLGQAILMRLLTPQGELARLGHPLYGSRLHLLVGMRNTETNRNLAKLYILESLQRETRIKKIVSVRVAPHAVYPESVIVSVSVVPIDEEKTLDLEPFTLEFSS